MNKKDVNGEPGKLEDSSMTAEVQKQGANVGGTTAADGYLVLFLSGLFYVLPLQ